MKLIKSILFAIVLMTAMTITFIASAQELVIYTNYSRQGLDGPYLRDDALFVLYPNHTIEFRGAGLGNGYQRSVNYSDIIYKSDIAFYHLVPGDTYIALFTTNESMLVGENRPDMIIRYNVTHDFYIVNVWKDPYRP